VAGVGTVCLAVSGSVAATALGAWLRQAVGQQRLPAQHAEEARRFAESKELQAQLGRLRDARRALARWRAAVLVLAGLGLAVGLWLLLGP
jgi:hypothetical protein